MPEPAQHPGPVNGRRLIKLHRNGLQAGQVEHGRKGETLPNVGHDNADPGQLGLLARAFLRRNAFQEDILYTAPMEKSGATTKL